MLQFTKQTIHTRVGEVISASNNCRQLRTKGIVYRFICKIYDKHSKMVAEHTIMQKGVFKAIAKDMHIIGEGYVEYTCHPHRKLI